MARASKSVIITGGNAGLGFECAKTIAQDGKWHVIIASRDMSKAASAVRDLKAASGNLSIEALPLDLASLASVRAFAANILDRDDLPPLGALVCNAGVQVVGELSRTVDGFETTFAVNHLGHFLLVNLLLGHLAAPARIVVVSSGTHDPTTIEGRFNPPGYESALALARPEEARGALSNIRRYSTSKLCNLLFAYELNRRLRANGHADITVNAFDPGAVPGTGLTRDYSPLLRLVLTWPPLLRLAGVRVESVITSGANMARLVLDPELEGVSGKYFRGTKEVASSKASYETRPAVDLWETSAELVALPSRVTLPLMVS